VITHPGRVYGLGYDATSFAIWPLSGGPALERFDRSEEGWRRAWTRFGILDRRDATPTWRRTSAPWILVNVLLGIAVWIGVAVVEVAVLIGAGRDVDELADSTAAGYTLALPLSIAGWVLFAYAGSRRARWFWLVLLVGGGLALSIVTGVIGQPEDGGLAAV
jgi:hypothetical protein